ncbi:MAG: hypothetical protein HY052_07110 [Proteobacteria bacterium]|nr:hypothetical protein [Pseudomonadota bacterium]
MKIFRKISDKFNSAVSRTKKVGAGIAIGAGTGFGIGLFCPPLLPFLVVGTAVAGGIVGAKVD